LEENDIRSLDFAGGTSRYILSVTSVGRARLVGKEEYIKAFYNISMPGPVHKQVVFDDKEGWDLEC